MISIEPFSDGYYLLDGELVSYNGTSLSVTNNAYEKMRTRTRLPLVKLDSTHYLATPESAIPHDTIAVPQSVDISEETPLLLKSEEAQRVASSGEWLARASADST